MDTYAVIGLGYVGLGLAIALAKQSPTLGYDIDERRINELQHHIDRNKLIDKQTLEESLLVYTHSLEEIKQANFYIVSVATPAYFYEMPNLKPLISASKALASILKKDDVVVYESTVYPGTTEEICIPILEQHSHLKNGVDFHVGYSPERINPADEQHTLYNITKIVSAQNKKTLKRIQDAYQSICKTVYPVSSIPTAEAIKVLENTQRDVNIALMNEFTQVMHALNLDMHEIIEGAKTKWSFVPFTPGLVGGHCISIDPLYLRFQAKRHGVPTDLIGVARKVNDGITQFIIQSMVKLFVMNKIDLNHITVGVFGVSYKPNTVDSRNSLSLKLVKELREYGFKCLVHDPYDHHLEGHGHVELDAMHAMNDLSVALVLVAHEYYRDLGLQKIVEKCKKPQIVMDIPNLFVKERLAVNGLVYWNL